MYLAKLVNRSTLSRFVLLLLTDQIKKSKIDDIDGSKRGTNVGLHPQGSVPRQQGFTETSLSGDPLAILFLI